VVGAFFTVWTVQRTRQIGLLKAMGASNWYVVRDAMGQLAVVLAASILIGTFVGLLLGSLVGEDVPFSLAARSVTASSLALGIASMAGSLVAIRRLTRVDPAISLSVEA
jgi:putative ABC transport system permease protein